MARRTSPVGMTPSFSPSMGSANSAKASWISCSCRAEMLCSFASFDCRSLGASLVLAFALRFGGYVDRSRGTNDISRIAGKSLRVGTLWGGGRLTMLAVTYGVVMRSTSRVCVYVCIKCGVVVVKRRWDNKEVTARLLPGQ